MTYETITCLVHGAPTECLRDPKIAVLRRLVGDWMTADGYIDRRGHLYVLVTSDGRVWAADHDVRNVEGAVLYAERWRDGDRVESEEVGYFAPDSGEFERCGIVPKLYGDAAAPV